MDVHKRHGTGDSNVELLTKKKNTPQKLNIFAPLVDGPSLFLEKKVSLFRGVFDRTQELTIGRECWWEKVREEELVEHWF